MSRASRFYPALLAFWAGLLFVMACQIPTATAQDEIPMSTRWELASIQTQEGSGRIPVAVLWIMPEEGWHFYSRNPGPIGMPTTITPLLLPDETPLSVHYPPGEKKPDVFEPDIIVAVYEGNTPFFIPLSGVADGDTVRLKATVEFLLCSTGSCWPVQFEADETWENIDIGALPRAEEQAWWGDWECAVKEECPPGTEPETLPSTTKEASIDDLSLKTRYFREHLVVSNLGKAILFALLAGFILNFMPCVLPVLALKLRALLPREGDGAFAEHCAAFRTHNVFFALGVLIFFLALAALISVTGMAWGQIFQNPLAVLVVATILFVLALSLFDVFHLPIIDLKGGTGRPKNVRTEALSTGMLVTLLATPCSGPFLGGVLAWGLSQPPLVIALVFVFIGIGMASPYLLLALFPRLYCYFPRPGNWMVHLERLVGFLVLATCIYLLTFLPNDYFIPTLFFLWGAGLAAWIWGKWAPPTMSRLHRFLVRTLAVAVVVTVGLVAQQFYGSEDTQWEEFTPELFAELHGQENLLLDFTAEWCPNCKFLEKTVLIPRELNPMRERYGLRTLKVDLTRDNPPGLALLRKLGSQSIPVVAIFPKGERRNNPVVLRDLFTKKQFRQAVREALE